MADRGFSVTLHGVDEAQARLEAVGEYIANPPNEALNLAILRLLRYMQAVVPVDTGRLKNSLHPFVEDQSAEIRSNVVYALPVEYMQEGKYSYIRRTIREEGQAAMDMVIGAMIEDINGAFSS